MKTIERADGSRLDRLLNLWPFCIDTDSIRSIGIAWLFKDGGRWRLVPRITGNAALFYNAVFFLRISFPFGVFVHVRWAKNLRRSFAEGSFGWKLNGRFTIGLLWLLALLLIWNFGWSYWYLFSLFALRFQSDASAAAGVTGPNYGQATGFDYGPH